MPQRFDPALAKRLREVHGAAAKVWLAHFDARLAAVCERWGLVLGAPFHGRYAWVAPAQRASGEPVVLKACVPDAAWVTEQRALHAFAGEGAVRLLDADAHGFLLLERLEPGTPLAVDDAAPTLEALLSVLRALPRPEAEAELPDTRDWARGFERLRARFGGGVGPFPPRLVAAAETRLRELHASRGCAVLLHGDLHPGNVLAARRAPWLAIDPKGVCGEPAYECGAYLRNLAHALRGDPAAAARIARAIDGLASELSLPRERIAESAAAQAVLAAWWSFEDHGAGWQPGIAGAELLDCAARQPPAATR